MVLSGTKCKHGLQLYTIKGKVIGCLNCTTGPTHNPTIKASPRRVKTSYKLRGLLFAGDSPELEELGLGKGVDTTSKKLKCSFCQAEVERINATEGTGEERKTIDQILTYNKGEITGWYDQMNTRLDKVIACPNCCLSVKKVKFPPKD